MVNTRPRGFCVWQSTLLQAGHCHQLKHHALDENPPRQLWYKVIVIGRISNGAFGNGWSSLNFLSLARWQAWTSILRQEVD